MKQPANRRSSIEHIEFAVIIGLILIGLVATTASIGAWITQSAPADHALINQSAPVATPAE